MEYFMMPTEKIPSLQQFKKTEKDVIGGLCSLANIPLSPETAQDQERRIRREIANSNERRRMQSINAGFQSLKTLLPHTDGEKLSKAAILQQTADYIFTLEQEKTQLLAQNNQLKRFIQEFSGSSPKRRRAEEKDEGIGSPDTLEEEKVEELRREMLELRQQLDKERSARMQLEEQLRRTETDDDTDEHNDVRSLDTQLHPERLKVITQQVEEEQALIQSQTLLRLQQIHAADRQTHSPQVLAPPTPPAPTHHPTVIVPAPTLTQHAHHHVTVVTMSPSVHTSTVSTSRQNLDTIVQAIQHIERTQERRASAEEEQRRAVIVSPAHVAMDTACSDTDTDTEGEDCSMK
ncbi:transcription factor AP-4-like isoform X1 [Seriola lalandi dorsalis]|uniref:Transcription factor AP-4 n=1 Tax=Seriola lalandi dorsalis TaxID=1841481 RepID=A0A3B4XSL6_SERLL|nr:transcription factor AP-4-like isoform X1 [Seriola lalandi dorsalis]XP_056228813.1 transcription factor AP-4-like isoform X1 [Seriola aureovittata]